MDDPRRDRVEAMEWRVTVMQLAARYEAAYPRGEWLVHWLVATASPALPS